jgi:arylformamidase
VTDWRTLAADELERQYSPSSVIGGHYQPYIDQYAQRSAAARAWFAAQTQAQAHFDLAYGQTHSQRLDLFLPANDQDTAPPLVVFIHGGYWQELSKNESQFAAIDAVQAGLAYAVLDYTLAPQASVADIVDECVQALGYLHANAAALGFDGRRMVVAGSSAGAHLAAMAALRCHWLDAALLVSGIYALEPLIHTTINHALGLDAHSARVNSPQAQDLSAFPRCVIAFGEHETEQFKQQSHTFARSIARPVTPLQPLQIEGRNHFDVVLDLLNSDSVLGRACLALIQRP